MSEADYTFEMSTRRTQFSDSDIIDGLRAFGATVGNRPFSKTAFNGWRARPFSAELPTRRFGAWHAALARAGIPGARRNRYTPEELVAHLEAVWRRIDRPPGGKKLTDHGTVTPRSYARIWGSLRRACERLALYHAGKITRRELLNPRPASTWRRTPLKPSLRYSVLQRDNFRCVLCGAAPANDPATMLEIDHIHPASARGPDDPSNLRTLCRACNRGKSDRLPPARAA